MKKLFLVILLSSFYIPQLSLAANRPIDKSWDIRNGARRLMDIDFFQAEGVDLSLASLNGSAEFPLTNDNLSVVWEITGWKDYTNVYAVTTGEVSQAQSNLSAYTLDPDASNLPPGTYRGFCRALQTDGTNLTQVAVLAWQKIKVTFSPDSRNYAIVGPLTYPIEFSDSAITNYFWTVLTAATNDVAELRGEDTASTLRITALETGTNNWNSAYGWGDHDLAGYLTGYTETDPAWSAGTNALWLAIASATDTNLAAVVAIATNDIAAVEGRMSDVESQTNLIQSAVQPTDSDYTNALALAGSALQVETDPAWNAGTGSIYTAIDTKADASKVAGLEDGSDDFSGITLDTTIDQWSDISVTNAVLKNAPISVTNDSTWTGWTTSGALDGTNIFLDLDEWMLSPVQSNGIADVTDSASSHQGGTFWTVQAVTNSVVVDLPYYGSDGQIKITAGSIVLPGATPGVTVTAVDIVGYDDRAEASVAKYVSGLRRIEAEAHPDDLTRKVYVDERDAASVASAASALSSYAASAEKTLRGGQLRLGNMWVVSPADTSGERWICSGGEISGDGELVGTTNEFIISKNDYPLMSFTSASAGLNIPDFDFAGTASNVTVSLYVATNGVTAAPFAEWTEDLVVGDWSRVLTPAVETYPTVSNGTYEITFTLDAAANPGYFRAMQPVGDSVATVLSDILHVDGLIENPGFQTLETLAATASNDIVAVESRMSDVESGTNNWNTAYGWGDHDNLQSSIADLQSSMSNAVTSVVLNGTTNTPTAGEIDLGTLVTSLQDSGTVGGTNRTATLTYDFTNNVWQTTVTDD